MNSLLNNSTGCAFSEENWLDKHHAVKARLRTDMMMTLPIGPGDRILDIGCGTGNWTILAAERAGLHGRVTGLDIDRAALDLAELKRQAHPLRSTMTFHHGSLNTLRVPLTHYNIVLLFNVLSYAEHPLQYLADIITRIGPRAKIIIKDTDASCNWFLPDQNNIQHRIIGPFLHEGDTRLENGYDPFFARRIPSIIGEVGLPSYVLSHSFTLLSPLVVEERDYIRANAQIIAEAALGKVEPAIISEWRSLFDEHDNSASIYLPGFMFTMTEFSFVLSTN